MELTDGKKQEISKRILLSRLRIISKNGFFGILLMNVKFALSDCIPHAATDCSEYIYINPEFVDRLTDRELDYLLEHEIMHIVLRHSSRNHGFDPEKYNIAADIVVNGNILAANNYDKDSISIGGELCMHKAPNGETGDKFTVEELYGLIRIKKTGKSGTPDSKVKGAKGGKEKRKGGKTDDTPGNSPGNDNAGSGWGNGLARKLRITPRAPEDKGWDEHLEPCEELTEEDQIIRDLWVRRIEEAYNAAKIRIENGSSGRGTVPAFAERMITELRNPQIDWRQILNGFIQEEICDYSFSPPDRRFEESPFFLPDFSEKDESVRDVLFMIDTSGSMSDDMITAAYSEIKGAIDQFNGKLQGWLGFFDAAVIEPKPFQDEDEFSVIRPCGGGGTDFQIIFEYVGAYMTDRKPVSIIILTDGFAPFPNEKLAGGIPVLWLLNNECVNPPWGKVARIKV